MPQQFADHAGSIAVSGRRERVDFLYHVGRQANADKWIRSGSRSAPSLFPFNALRAVDRRILMRHTATRYQLPQGSCPVSVRKRVWKTSKGEQKEAWIVDYTDQAGERHIQTFQREREADEYHATVRVDVRQGVHTAHEQEHQRRRGGERLDRRRRARRARASTVDSIGSMSTTTSIRGSAGRSWRN